MKRRTVLATLGAITLGGCSGGGSTEQPSKTPSENPSRSPTATRSASPTQTPTESSTPSESPTSAWNPVIYYDSCVQISVQAATYDSVTLYFEDSLQTFDDGYQSPRAFRGTGANDGEVVYEVTVRRGDREIDRANPELEACLETPTPTPTEEPPTPSPTADPKTEERISYETSYAVYSGDGYAEIDGTNNNPYPVDMRIKATFYRDGEPIKSREQTQTGVEGSFFFTIHYDGNPNYPDSAEAEIDARRSR